MSYTSITFRIFHGAQLVREERSSLSVIKLGKVASAHVRLEDESVSRMHAIIEVTDGVVSLVDLGSTRGTFVNGQRITKATLQSGDSLQLGNLRLEIAITTTAPAAVAAPPPPPTQKVIPMQHSIADTSNDTHEKAVQVAAMLGDSVIGVKHVANPKAGKLSATTLGMFAMGATALLASAVSFGLAVKTAAHNEEVKAYTKNVLHKPARAYRAESRGVGTDLAGFGGAALGIGLAAAGLARAKREKQSPYYRIGTAAGVDLPLETTPDAAFPLVAPKGADFVLNYNPTMTGDMTTPDGRTVSLAELARGAAPSASVANAVELPIPTHAKIRVKAGQTTLLVAGMAKPKAQPAGFFAPDKRALVYGAASLAVHLGLIAVLRMVPVEDSSAVLDPAVGEVATTRTDNFSQQDPNPDKPEPNEQGDSGKGQGQEAAAMTLPEGAAGDRSSQQTQGRLAIAKHDASEEHLAREEAIEAARTAGILGSESLSDSLRSVTGQLDLSNGPDAMNSWGPIFGADGSVKGFGTGRSDMGPGGGCTQEPCGIQGTGRYGTIPGTRGGNEYSQKFGDPVGGHGHDKLIPTVHVDKPTATDGLDKKIIARYIHRALPTITYCYEKELLSRPDINGTVNINFFISGDGTVAASSATSAFDGAVGSCVAAAVKDIHFPATEGGAGVTVNYPFTFHKAGQ